MRCLEGRHADPHQYRELVVNSSVDAYVSSWKYILSTALQDPRWEPTTILRGLDAVRALRERPGRLGVMGSIGVAQQLVAADLVDEYRLFVYRALVGVGAGVLADERRLDLELVESTPFPSGVALLRYRRR